MQKGTIKKLITTKRYGFVITPDGKEIFFHGSNLDSADFATLQEGQKVEFEIEKTFKGLQAVNVNLVDQE